MYRKILKKDFQRNKLITLILLLFVTMSTMLLASASSVVVELMGSINNLYEKANGLHFLQMHSGEIDQEKIDSFVKEKNYIKNQQSIPMLNIDGANILIGKDEISEQNSVIDIGFVTQSPKFDYLLDLNNEIIKVKDGEIAIPIYYMEKYNLKIGEKIKIKDGNFVKNFEIKDFLRDSQMNSSFASSKRFVVSEGDYKILEKNTGKAEYLIEFQVKDLEKVGQLENDYINANLPQNGPAVTYNLIKVINSLSDGLVVAIIVVVSVLLILIAILCLRFTIITTIEEDYSEIGAMKAIGIPLFNIKKIYLFKYSLISLIGGIGGYLLSLIFKENFTSKITLYMGSSDKTIYSYIVPIISTMLVILIIILFCLLVFRKFNKISCVDALKYGCDSKKKQKKSSKFNIYNTKLRNINIFLGIKNVLARLNTFILLTLLIIICTFIIIVPMNLLSTLTSTKVITYMGTGISDLRMDLQNSSVTNSKINDINIYLKNDQNIKKYSILTTSRYKAIDTEGNSSSITVEEGDFSLFPLSYVNGREPKEKNEIALSYLNAEEFKVNIGDTLKVLDDNGNKINAKVCGIYQDITNGGKTAKANFEHTSKSPLRYMVNMDFKEGTSLELKKSEYSNLFSYAKVTNVSEFMRETLGNTLEQLRLMVKVSLLISTLILILISSLFLKMLLAKDINEITIMRSIGFSKKDIQIQYFTSSILVFVVGVILGTILSNTVGAKLVGMVMSTMGAGKIEFIINPLLVYMIIPILIVGIGVLTTLISTRYIKDISISKLNCD